MSVSPSLKVRLDAWAMRCLFNRRFLPRIERGEWTSVRRDANPVTTLLPGQPPGTLTVEEYYGSSLAQWTVKVHYYEEPGGRKGASGRMDPKQLRDPQRQVKYHLLQGTTLEDKLRREPELCYAHDPRVPRWAVLPLQRLFGMSKRLRCWWYGPVDADEAEAHARESASG